MGPRVPNQAVHLRNAPDIVRVTQVTCFQISGSPTIRCTVGVAPVAPGVVVFEALKQVRVLVEGPVGTVVDPLAVGVVSIVVVAGSVVTVDGWRLRRLGEELAECWVGVVLRLRVSVANVVRRTLRHTLESTPTPGRARWPRWRQR